MEGSNQWKYGGSSKQIFLFYFFLTLQYCIGFAIFEVGNISVWKIRQYLPLRNFSQLNENDDLFT